MAGHPTQGVLQGALSLIGVKTQQECHWMKEKGLWDTKGEECKNPAGMTLQHEGKTSCCSSQKNEEVYPLSQSFSRDNKVKRKITLVIGYLGTKFRGMQIHRDAGTRTVESVLEEALFKAGAISSDNYGDLKKIGWSRASRTDKGVHAVKCVVVAKLLVRPHDFDNEGFNIVAKDEFNAVLPNDLHVFRAGRIVTTNPFVEYQNPLEAEQNALTGNTSIEKWKAKEKKSRKRMNRRDNAIVHRDHHIEDEEAKEEETGHCVEDNGQAAKILEGMGEGSADLGQSQCGGGAAAAMLHEKIQEKKWEKVEVLQRALRSEMITTVFACQLDEKPILVGNTELLRVFIRGKSFLYHQIRLMIGAAVAEALELVPEGTVEAALRTPYQIRFALAPSEGLVLSGQGFTGGSSYGNSAVLDPTELSQLQGTLVDYDGGSGNSMASKGRVQALCKPGDILASEDFKLKIILPEIARAWEAENGNLVDDWMAWTQRNGRSEEFHLALVAAEEKMAVADHSNELIKLNGYRKLAFAKENAQLKEFFPRGFCTKLMVNLNLIPGPKVQSIRLALLERMKSGTLPQLATAEELMDCVAREGVESMAREGGFVGCLVAGKT